jgi:hypothetical protein
MDGINVIVGTKYLDDELTAVAHATAEIRDALVDGAYILDATVHGGGSQQIGVELEVATPDIGATESALNVTPSVESFEQFSYEEE